MPANSLKVLKNRHLALIDFLLDNPTLQLYEVADHFKMSHSGFYRIHASDVFQQALADRRSARQDYADYRVTMKLDRVVEKSLSKLEEVLDAEPTPGFVLKATEILLTQRGTGPAKQVHVPANSNVNVTLNTVSSEVLAAAQQKAQQQYLKAPVEDAEVVENEKLVHNSEPAAIPAPTGTSTHPHHREPVEFVPPKRVQVERTEVQGGEEV